MSKDKFYFGWRRLRFSHNDLSPHGPVAVFSTSTGPLHFVERGIREWLNEANKYWLDHREQGELEKALAGLLMIKD